MKIDINKIMSNIINFPLDRITPPSPWSLSAAERHDLAEHYVDIYTEVIFENLHAQGFDIESDMLTNDIILAMEILKSGILRELDLEHPLQTIQDKLHDLLE